MSTARVPSITSPLQDSFFLSNCLPSLNLQRLLWVLFCLVLSETVDSDYRLSPLSALQSVYDALFNSLLYSKRDERRNEGRELPCRVVLWVGGWLLIWDPFSHKRLRMIHVRFSLKRKLPLPSGLSIMIIIIIMILFREHNQLSLAKELEKGIAVACYITYCSLIRGTACV